MSDTDLPSGYRWATETETEAWTKDPLGHPEIITVPRTTDHTGKPYTEGEADLAVPL